MDEVVMEVRTTNGETVNVRATQYKVADALSEQGIFGIRRKAMEYIPDPLPQRENEINFGVRKKVVEDTPTGGETSNILANWGYREKANEGTLICRKPIITDKKSTSPKETCQKVVAVVAAFSTLSAGAFIDFYKDMSHPPDALRWDMGEAPLSDGVPYAAEYPPPFDPLPFYKKALLYDYYIIGKCGNIDEVRDAIRERQFSILDNIIMPLDPEGTVNLAKKVLFMHGGVSMEDCIAVNMLYEDYYHDGSDFSERVSSELGDLCEMVSGAAETHKGLIHEYDDWKDFLHNGNLTDLTVELNGEEIATSNAQNYVDAVLAIYGVSFAKAVELFVKNNDGDIGLGLAEAKAWAAYKAWFAPQ
ncbi:MAG: hypothetical protein FWG96_07110 [Methanomassiliicoccaceae archaeon]|nr:hypothetical protein [Methanomassiliicoccaceae archaeon]